MGLEKILLRETPSGEVASAVPGIVLTDCTINGYNDSAVIHDMETLNSVIVYNNCKIKGDVLNIGTDVSDTGLGKVIIGQGTTVSITDTSLVKEYNADDINTYDGTKSGIYLADGLKLSYSDGVYTATQK